MIVTMRNYELAAVDNSKKYKGWDSQCIAKDSFLEGYRKAMEEMGIDMGHAPTVEVEFKDGSHQLGVAETGGVTGD